MKNPLSKAKSTTDSVMAKFRQTLTDLGAVRDVHNQIADAKEAEAATLNTEANVARREAVKATETLGRLEAIFG